MKSSTIKIVGGSIIVVISILVIKLLLLTNVTNGSFQLLNLNELNNRKSFLWVPSEVDTTWIHIQGLEMNSRKNSAKITYYIEEFDSTIVANPKGISISIPQLSKLSRNNNFTLSYKEYLDHNIEDVGLFVGFSLNSKLKEDGLYKYFFKAKSSYFQMASNPVVFEIELNNSHSLLFILLMSLLIISILFLLVWFLYLKPSLHPCFKEGGQLEFIDDAANTIYISRNARLLIIGSGVKEKENVITKLFKGPVQYIYRDREHYITIKPYIDRSKKLKYRLNSNGITQITDNRMSGRYMINNTEYTLTHNKSKIKFIYLNIKHQ
jgi:hypothetical protein|tara:strand:- start:466 stop:1431 length:966 start_codon:yes stop_codon:yes gene_type:complete